MAERLIEVFSGSDPEKDLKEMLEEKSIIGYWTVKTSEELWQTKILALAENSEKILDSLEQRFTQDESFRAILFQVEASLPRAQEEEKEEEKRLRKRRRSPRRKSSSG